MVTTRSSNQTSKKAKLESDKVLETSVEDQDNDFQEPVPLPRSRIKRGRQSSYNTKLPVSNQSTTIITQSISLTESSFSTIHTEQEAEEIDKLTEINESSTQNVDELTEESPVLANMNSLSDSDSSRSSDSSSDSGSQSCVADIIQ